MKQFLTGYIVFALVLLSQSIAWSKLTKVTSNNQIHFMSELHNFEGTLYAASIKSKIWNRFEFEADRLIVSHDNGVSWNNLGIIDNNSKLLGLRIDSIVKTPKGSLLVLGFAKYQDDESDGAVRVVVFKSTDSGNSFTKSFQSEPYLCCYRTSNMVIDPDGNLALGFSQDQSIRLFKSLDDGDNWQQFTTIPQSYSTNPMRNWLTFSGPKNLFVTDTEGYVYQSDLTNINIVSAPENDSSMESTSLFSFQFAQSQFLYQTTNWGKRIRRTNDAGASWTPLDLALIVPDYVNQGLAPAVLNIFKTSAFINSSPNKAGNTPVFGNIIQGAKLANNVYTFYSSYCENTQIGWDCTKLSTGDSQLISSSDFGKDKNGIEYLYVFKINSSKPNEDGEFIAYRRD